MHSAACLSDHPSSRTRHAFRIAAGLSATVLVMILGGCVSAEPEIVAPRVVPPANWFCSMANSEEWECVENEELDVSAQRSSQVARRTTPPAEIPELIEELSREAGQNRASRAARQATPSPPITPTSTPSPASDAPSSGANTFEAAPAAQTVPRRAPNQAEQPHVEQQDDLPLYRSLAYRPDRAVRLLDLPPEYFAVQLLASASKENLERFAAESRLGGLAAARIASNDRLLYILILGIYADRRTAERAAADVPDRILNDVNPWVRSLGSLQQAMMAGDELAGTSDI